MKALRALFAELELTEIAVAVALIVTAALVLYAELR